MGSSIYIEDTLRIDDLSIDDQSSMLRSSIYTVTPEHVQYFSVALKTAFVIVQRRECLKGF